MDNKVIEDPTYFHNYDDEKPISVTIEEENSPLQEELTKESTMTTGGETTISKGGGKGGNGDETSSFSSMFTKKWILAIVLLVIVLVITIPIVKRKDKSIDDTGEIPITVDYRTGVSLITYYEVNSHISTRLVRTVLSMEIANALDCASIHGVTLQIPLGSRISSLQTTTDAGCKTDGQVLAIDDARETFLETATKSNLPGAYVEQQDSFTYSLQVSIPPLGTSMVELVVEGLLLQRLGEVGFEIPILPNEQVDQIVFNLTVDDVGTTNTPTHFVLDLPNKYMNEGPVTDNGDKDDDDGSNSTEQVILSVDDIDDDANNLVYATGFFSMNLPDAREHDDLPLVLSGRYTPASLPDDGIVYMDNSNGCFEHYFSPSFLQAMPRNILFLLDVSRSMSNEKKLDGAKVALKTFIETLTPNDNFMIQTFAARGTERLWGMAQATDEEKVDAMAFIDEIQAEPSDKTDLHEAFLEGLLRFERKTIKERMGESVSILMAFTDGFANSGERDRGTIAEDIYKRNREGQVKIFSLGFEGSADMELLDTIAIMNGGVAKPIFYSNDDDGYKEQIQFFMESEFGTVLLSDVEINLEGGTMYAETQRNFALLADGYEIVVRGLFESHDEVNSQLRVVTQAATSDGREEWRALPDSSLAEQESITSLCYQSYAHDRITHLLRLRDAASLVDDELLSDLLTLTKPCEQPKDLATCMEEEALAVALNASLVTKGLTAMVTIDDANCVPLDGNETEICQDGTSSETGRPVPKSAPAAPTMAYARGGQESVSIETDVGYDASRSADVDYDPSRSAAPGSFCLCAWQILLSTLSFALLLRFHDSGTLF